MTTLESYCSKILNGEINACEKLKVECDRLISDLQNPGKYHFDEKIANKHINFIERFCKIPSGKIGAPFVLEEFQKAQLQATFGFVDDNGIRKYNEVLIIEGRKNGKSSLLAAILIDMLCNDHEGSPQCVTAATMLDQAKLTFNAALKMVRQSPELSRHIRKRVSDLYYPNNMGTIRALANNTNSLDGLDLHCAVIDELSAIKNRDTYDLLKQAMGARLQPLLFTISTNGYVRESIFDAQYAYAANILNGTIQNEKFLPFIYELDHPSEWEDPDCYIKANPGLGTIKSVDYLNEMVQKAKDDLSFKATVLCKDFNLPQSGSTAWLPFEAVVNEEVAPMENLEHSYAIGGVDLSSVRDLTCATLLIRKPNDEKIYVLQKYFIPQAKLDDLANEQKKEAPYKLWQEQGWLEINEGAQVDYSRVTQWFVEMVEKHDIRPLWVHYDRALANYFAAEMISYGFDMIPTAQGPFTFSYPMKEMGAAFSDHKVIYQNNPILRWCLANTAYKSTNKDGIETIQPVKIQQNRRIDGMVSLLNAWVGYVKHYDEYMPYVR